MKIKYLDLNREAQSFNSSKDGSPSKFKARLVYIASSRLAGLYSETMSQKTNQATRQQRKERKDRRRKGKYSDWV